MFGFCSIFKCLHHNLFFSNIFRSEKYLITAEKIYLSKAITKEKYFDISRVTSSLFKKICSSSKKKPKQNFGFGLISQSSSIVLGNSPAVPFLLLRLRIRFSFTWLPTRKAHTTTTKFSSVVGCVLVQKNS